MSRLKQSLLAAVTAVLAPLGYKPNRLHPPASAQRSVGDVGEFLEDVRARGLSCRGIEDVGANTGGFTRKALAVYPDATFLLIEPQSEMAPHFEALKQKSPKVEYLIAGAGSQAGELIQTIFENRAGSTFLGETDEVLLRAGKQRKVPIITLDEVLRERGFDPTIVHVNAQGYELEVLKGAATCFGRTEIFVVEAATMAFLKGQPTIPEVLSFMTERGYAFYDITWIMRRPLDGALGLVDLAFVKAEGPLRASKAWNKS